MLVLVTMIVVNMRSDHALAHRVEAGDHPLFDVCVPYVEAQLQIVKVRVGDEMLQRGGRAKLIGGILERDSHTASLCEH